MRVFLTGATGVIGRRVLPLLVGLDHSVTAVVHRPQSRAEVERAGAAPVQVDLFARAAIQRAVAGHDAVINLATHLPAGLRMFLPGAWTENDRIRRIASANLVDAAIAGGVTRFIQESFAPVYPDRGEAWIDERIPIAPVRYNRSVIDAERSAQRFSSGGRTGVVLRFAAFYGPDSWFSRELAEALGVPAPKLAPPWMKYLFGSLGEMLARSLRISNRKLREECAWVPKYPTVREGWRAVAAAISASSPVSGTAR